MKQIIFLHIGRTGLQLLPSLWTNLEQNNSTQQSAFYEQGKARLVCFDLDSSQIDKTLMHAQTIKSDPSQFISGYSSSSNTFASAYYGQSAEKVYDVLESIRFQIQKCDCLQGFISMNSIAGGTGSGFISLLSQKIGQLYPNKMKSNFILRPSIQKDEKNQFVLPTVDLYNSVYGLSKLIENSDLTVLSQYQLLLKLVKNQHYQVALLMSRLINQVVYPFSKNSECNQSLRKLITNLIQYKRHHFVSGALAPVISQQNSQFHISSEKRLLFQILSQKNQFVTTKKYNRRSSQINTLSAAFMFRGMINRQILLNQKKRYQRVQRLQGLFSTTFNVSQAPLIKRSAAALFNDSRNSHQTKKYLDQYNHRWRKKIWLYKYQQQGMQQLQMLSLQQQLRAVVLDQIFSQNRMDYCQEMM